MIIWVLCSLARAFIAIHLVLPSFCLQSVPQSTDFHRLLKAATSIEEADDFARNMLPSCLFVIHDAGGRGENYEPKLTRG